MKDISYWFLCLLLLFLDLHYLVWFFSENIKGNSRKTYLGNNYKGNSIVSLLSVTFLSLSFSFFFLVTYFQFKEVYISGLLCSCLWFQIMLDQDKSFSTIFLLETHLEQLYLWESHQKVLVFVFFQVTQLDTTFILISQVKKLI